MTNYNFETTDASRISTLHRPIDVIPQLRYKWNHALMVFQIIDFSIPEEHRKSMRYKPRNDAFVSLGTGLVKVGSMIDISRKGLSMKHFARVKAPRTEITTVSIFIEKNRFFLADLPCIKIYETVLHTGDCLSSSFQTRRCGIKFGMLSASQESQLEHFLKLHTEGSTEKYE